MNADGPRRTVFAAMLVVVTAPLAAQGTGRAQASVSASVSADVKVTEAKPGLLARAKITPQAATATALANVANGKLDSAEIEEEDGKLIYSFDIKVPGKTGIEEVNVDAMSGKVVGVEHETPEQIARERKADSVAAAKAAKGRGRGGS